MTANPTVPAASSSSATGAVGPWFPPVPSLAALPVDPTKTTPKPAYYKLQFGDDYTGFSYYVRTLSVVIGRNCERAVPPPDQLEPGVPTNPPLQQDDRFAGDLGVRVEGPAELLDPNGDVLMEDVKPTDGLDISMIGDDLLAQIVNPPTNPTLTFDPNSNLHPDFQLPSEDIKPVIPPSPPRAHTTPPESHPHAHLNGISPSIPPQSAPPSSHLQLEPESYFDPMFAPPAPPPPPPKRSGPVDHVDVDLGPLKSVSRNHARIDYHNELGHFCLEIIGRNGAWVDDRYYVKGSTVPLNQGSQIQIATRIFSFILPPSADPSPYSPFGHEDTANVLEDVPYPYNLPPGEVGYAEFYGEPGPGPSSVANMTGRIPPAFNVFAGTDGLAMGIEGAEGKVWDDEWDNSDEDDSDSDDDEDSYDEDDEGALSAEPEGAVGVVPKVKIRLKTDAVPPAPPDPPIAQEVEATKRDKQVSPAEKTPPVPPAPPETAKAGAGKAGKTTTKAAAKKKVTKADETAEKKPDTALEVANVPEPPASQPATAATPAAPAQSTPSKPKKPPAKKESKKKKKAEPVQPKVEIEHDVTEPMVATLAAALAENPALQPPPTPKPPPTLAAATAPAAATPTQPRPGPVQPGKPSMPANGPNGANAGPANPAVRPPGPPRPAQPGQPGTQAQAGPQITPGKPPPGEIPRPPQAGGTPQIQNASATASPAPTPTRQDSSSAPPEPPKPFYLTELIETPGRPGHIVVNVPIPPSGAGPRPPPGPLIGLDGQPFIGPPPNKPTATFATIIHRALLYLPRGRGTLGEVCNWVAGEWEWFRLNIDAGWQNSIRHNLSLNKAFLKVPRIPEDDPESKGSVWIIDPEEGPLFEEKQRRDALKSAGKEKNAEVRRERERQKVEERARKQREMAMEAHAAHGPHATASGMVAGHAKPVLPRPTPIPPRPVQRAQAPTAVSANAKGLLQPKAKISVSIQTLTPAHRAKSVIATTDSSGNPLPFACDGTTLTLDQATFGHLTGDIIDKLTLLGAAGAVDVLSAWVINKNKNQAARAAQQAAAAQASTKPTAASIKAGLTAPRNGATPATATTAGPAAAGAAKPIPKKPVAPAAGASIQKFGPAPPGASLTKVIGMIAEVANAKGDVNTVGPNAGALLRYIRVVGVDIDLRVAERIWATGVVPALPTKKGAQPGAKPNGATGTAGTATTQASGVKPVTATPNAAAAGAAKPVGPPAAVAPKPSQSAQASQTAPSAPVASAVTPTTASVPGTAAPIRPPPPVSAAAAPKPLAPPGALATGGPVKRKLEEGAASEDAKKAKIEAVP